ncbi:MAG: UDP-N-acetylmuramate:L-alanyl-gamma-D-glutamyl-meso-diaminopimelate ligase [Oligoflexia bacterium]|nr:UDP-N-acetylmuramate:L-alanyl-gamma-D-glutamyl-meso-diaminopimelate ligase [Oligoflexia bacterium]
MKTIYMVGICGTGMGNLALMLKSAGYNVTGSDSGIYPPMSTRLESAGVKILRGYSEENLKNLKTSPGLVIIGNVIRRDNPEAQYVINSGMDYMSLPEALREFFFKDKETVVISGTHGKTTTSFMMAWMLENAGLKPGFFIGGIPKDFEVMGRSAEGRYFVVEGDEYDTAFFDKVPKFFHYNPKYAVINGIEFDHADIYPDIESIKQAFRKLIEMVPPDGIIVYYKGCVNTCELVKQAACRTVSFAIDDPDADYSAANTGVKYGDADNTTLPSMIFTVRGKNGSNDFAMHIPGRQNVLNALAVIALAGELDLDISKVKHSMSSFRGVKRRQEIFGVSGGRIIIDDFAHHPTAVAYSIEAVREWYYPRRVWCVFEPRSATSRSNILQAEMIEALGRAEKVLLAPVHQPERLTPDKRFDPEKVCGILKVKGIEADYFDDVDSIVEHLGFSSAPGDVILIMSNGGFDNIYTKLMKVFE